VGNQHFIQQGTRPGSGSEIDRGRTEMFFHYVAEFITAIALIASGAGLIVDAAWGPLAYLIASGMLIYTLINSAGYFAQRRQLSMVMLFVVLIILSIVGLRLIVQL
jgi:hypothetical protein